MKIIEHLKPTKTFGFYSPCGEKLLKTFTQIYMSQFMFLKPSLSLPGVRGFRAPRSLTPGCNFPYLVSWVSPYHLGPPAFSLTHGPRGLPTPSFLPTVPCPLPQLGNLMGSFLLRVISEMPVQPLAAPAGACVWDRMGPCLWRAESSTRHAC